MKKRSDALAVNITKSASKQTYKTIQFLVDRERRMDAFRAYAYFRWVDDQLDDQVQTDHDRAIFLIRQVNLIERCYLGNFPEKFSPEEEMLIEMVRNDHQKSSGLQCYIRNMMAVMEFDTHRKGLIVSREELAQYTQHLSVAVTEALLYFIGNTCSSPVCDARYSAVTAAHIVHMLRDTFEDIQNGYYNIPREDLDTYQITPFDVDSDAYRTWVKSHVVHARMLLDEGKRYIASLKNLRCRIAGFAYVSRFENVLDQIEGDGYSLQEEYTRDKTLKGTFKTILSSFSSAINYRSGKSTFSFTPSN